MSHKHSSHRVKRIRDVGIVMPVYKQKDQHLKEALHSILNQSYKHFKLVIVLDGASSHVARLVQREVAKDRRVRVIRHRRNKGISAALNRGFQSLYRRKHIRYLTWVSSDNVYYPDFVRELRRTLRRSKSKVGLAYSSFHHIDDNGERVFGDEYHKFFRTWQNQPIENLLDVCFVGTSFMYKRRYAERAGGYELEPVEDYDYWLRLTDYCQIGYKQMELMGYRVQSPYSVSKLLSSSPTAHSRWRYAINLAKFRARQRRGISMETTVVVPVLQMNESIVRGVEELYEQAYSNYKVVIVDGTIDGSATAVLRDVSDPRVLFLSSPGSDQLSMVKLAFNTGHVSTPFAVVYNTASDSGQRDLQVLAHHLRSVDPTYVSGVALGQTGIEHVDVHDASLRLDTLYFSEHLQGTIG